MEGVDGDLSHKEEQKNSGDLKETLHIDQVTKAAPRPGHTAGGCQSNQRPQNQSRSPHLQKHQRGFHSFATDRQSSEKKNSRVSCPARSPGRDLAEPLFHLFFQLWSGAPHVNYQRCDHDDRHRFQDRFAQRFIAEEPGHAGAKIFFDRVSVTGLHLKEQVTQRAADSDRRDDCRVDGRTRFLLTGPAEIRKDYRYEQERLEAFAQNNDERLKHYEFGSPLTALEAVSSN